ncbi:MAG: rhodanese homology domain-containing protein [Pseudomonas sp.]
MSGLPLRGAAQVRRELAAGRELALVDLREEARYAGGHPLFAVQISLSRLELEVLARIPRRDTPVTLYDGGEGLLERAAAVLAALGYHDVAVLDGDLDGWRAAGGELFIDVNVPSKAFGELVASELGTPLLAPEHLAELQAQGADLVVLDARRYDEYRTMSIPGGISVPGAELVLRARELAPRPQTWIVVNCAGRTRSIIGAQSLLNAGIPNPVKALRNGTIGWSLAGLALEHGQQRRYPDLPDSQRRAQAAQAARSLADAAGVGRAGAVELARWQADPLRTTYLFDVRSDEEYARGHLPGARPVPGGQLVQETDHYASVRGARIALVDDDGVRANMSASWLAQMGWDVWVLDGLAPTLFSERGDWSPPLPEPPQVALVAAVELAQWLRQGDTVLLDFTGSANHVARHIPGARWALRAQLPELLARLPRAARYVATCGNGSLARYAVADLERLGVAPAYLLDGGTAAWIEAGLPVEQGNGDLLSPRIDRYRRPYEGTDNPHAAMQAYLDWEYGLVAQLARDGTHRFRVLSPLPVGHALAVAG